MRFRRWHTVGHMAKFEEITANLAFYVGHDREFNFVSRQIFASSQNFL